MTLAPPIETTDSSAIPDFPILRLTLAQYHQMIDAGIFDEDSRVELLEGWLVEKMTKKPLHSALTTLVRQVIERLLPAGWFIIVQEPIPIANSEPEPDLSIVRGDVREYLEHHPTAANVGLVIEVSDRTLVKDRTVKLRIYAGGRIPVYWIVNLIERVIDVYTDPSGEGKSATYTSQRRFRPGDSVPVVIDGSEIGQIAVSELFTVKQTDVE
jgi:Uma2 family endonuclease